jgi:hypothetical protein
MKVKTHSPILFVFSVLKIVRVTFVFTTWAGWAVSYVSIWLSHGGAPLGFHPYIMYPYNTDIHFRWYILTNMVSKSLFFSSTHLSSNHNPRVCRHPCLTRYQSSLPHKGSRRPTRRTPLTSKMLVPTPMSPWYRTCTLRLQTSKTFN